MFKYHNSEITDAIVDVMMPYGNHPHIMICVKDKIQHPERIYERAEDGCYFHQGENGETDFVYHGGEIKQIGTAEDGLPIYETVKNLNGFGGSVYTRKVRLPQGLAYVKLGGPWSGGCYCANEHLPKPAIEVSLYTPEYGCGIGGYNLTIEKMQAILDHFQAGWRIVTSDTGGFEKHKETHAAADQMDIITENVMFPLLVYQGKTKNVIRQTKEGEEWLNKLTKEARQKVNYWLARRDYVKHA